MIIPVIKQSRFFEFLNFTILNNIIKQNKKIKKKFKNNKFSFLING
jgi:hypothetical protein